MNEWTFAAEIKEWWNQEFPRHPEWKLANCFVEEGVPGSRDRSDLVVYGGGPVLGGELRLPDRLLADPWHPDNLLDAIHKATSRGARWAFTSDSTSFLLIDTQRSGPPITRVVQQVPLVSFQRRAELDSPTFLTKVKEGWLQVLRVIAPVSAGIVKPTGLPADELFINSLRALLRAPVSAIRDCLNEQRIADPKFADKMVRWMVDEQGWTHDPNLWESEILRAAQSTTYVFATRLMFYDALRRSQPKLSPLDVPAAKASIAEAMFQAYFRDARIESGDYDTLFGWDQICTFALMAEAALPAWRRVIEHLETFDLSHIGYDILGKMFERLIDPHERYQWGQHYTNPDVVDLMLSFALPDGTGPLLDPAVGGGTFLVRAYVRKKALDPSKTHQEILKELYGLDISGFAATLATVNLAIRHLDFSDNYPLVAARSFFQVDPASTFMAFPAPRGVSLSGGGKVPVVIDRVRAISCNPPYVRLQELGLDRQREAAHVITRNINRVPVPKSLHGLSNYHLYFWFHGAQFLEPNGRMVLITAGEWLDSDYGVVLQKWLLDHFRIECCIESIGEPWFSEARVGTVVLSVQLCDNAQTRDDNLVRFVLVRKPLRELYGLAESDAEHMRHVDALRDRILALTGLAGESGDLDWSAVQQRDLRTQGSVMTEV